MTKDLNDYLSYQSKVDGWLSVFSAQILNYFHQIHIKNHVKGNIFEIGVHHGKLSLLLGVFLRDTETLGVCDLFDLQDENTSGSGNGVESVFFEHWDKLFKSRDQLAVFKENSSQLSPQHIGSGFRFFSVDGGHTCRETYSDLKLASQTIAPMGIICIDDVYESNFPGVSEGFNRFMHDDHSLQPLLMVGGRMLLCKKECWALYKKELDTPEFLNYCNDRRGYVLRQEYFGKEYIILLQFTKLQFFLKLCKNKVAQNKRLSNYLLNSRMVNVYRRIVHPNS